MWTPCIITADGRRWPWGDVFEPANVPPISTERTFPKGAAVDAHPGGASVYGALDMVGNVYQYTDRFVDDHSAKAVLRGGNRYLPKPAWVPTVRGSTLAATPGNWYHPVRSHGTGTAQVRTVWTNRFGRNGRKRSDSNLGRSQRRR